MEKEFYYHYRVKRGVNFKHETPSYERKDLEIIGTTDVSKTSFTNGDELFRITSKEYIDIFSTFELKIEYF